MGTLLTLICDLGRPGEILGSPWGCLRCPWGASVMPLGDLWESFGAPGVRWGGPWDVFQLFWRDSPFSGAYIGKVARPTDKTSVSLRGVKGGEFQRGIIGGVEDTSHLTRLLTPLGSADLLYGNYWIMANIYIFRIT